MTRALPLLLLLTACDEASDLDAYDLDDLDAEVLPDDQAPPPPTLAVFGTCPGPVTVNVGSATPFGTVRLVYGLPGAAITVPSGPCAGLQIQVASPSVTPAYTATGGGTVTITPTLPPSACGKIAYALDAGSCTVSAPVFL